MPAALKLSRRNRAGICFHVRGPQQPSDGGPQKALLRAISAEMLRANRILSAQRMSL